MGKNTSPINSFEDLQQKFNQTSKPTSFGGARKNIEKIEYLANKIAGGESLDLKENKFFDEKREDIYKKVNQIMGIENTEILEKELNSTVNDIKEDQNKGYDIITQIDNTKDKEAGKGELNQIKKDTDQVVDKVKVEAELIAEIQKAKKNLNEKQLNKLTKGKTNININQNSVIEKKQKNNDVLNLDELKDEKEKITNFIYINKKVLESLQNDLKSDPDSEIIINKIKDYTKELENLEEQNRNITEKINSLENKNSDNKLPKLEFGVLDNDNKNFYEKIYPVLTKAEQEEVEALLNKSIEDFKDRKEQLIKEGKSNEEASEITYNEWQNTTKDGVRYLEILENAEKRVTMTGTPDNVYSIEVDLKNQAKILDDLTNEEIDIKNKYFEIKEKLEKDENLSDEERKQLETDFEKYEKLKQEINDKVGKQTKKVNELLEKRKQKEQEKTNPIIEKNNQVLTELQKEQQEKVKKFFEDQAKQKEQGEKNIGFFKKTLDWWNNLENKKIKIGNKEFASGKIGKTIMSAGFIGTTLFVTGDQLDLLPKNQTFFQKIASRTFLAGLSSAIITSNFTKNTAGNIKEKWNKLSTTQKVLVGAGLGVGGAGAFIHFAGATTLGITIGAIATKLGINKVLFDKKIDNIKIEKEKSEKRIEELNAKIKSFENDPNFDVEALMKELPEVQAELEKYNNKLRNWKIGKSLTSGVISLGSGLGSMAASHLEMNDKAREFIDKSLKKIGTFINSNKDGNPILEDNKIDDSEKLIVKPEAIIDGDIRKGITYTFRDQLCADEELAKKLGIDSAKLNDPSYVAKITKEIAIKTGYMDNQGHEIRVGKEGVGKIAYVLGVDNEGRIEVKEVEVETGKPMDTPHHEGDKLEKKLESYEYEKIKKTYADIEKAYGENSGIVAPERTPEYEQQLSNSYLMGDDNQEYLENNYSNTQANTPDDLSNDEIVAPEKVNTGYTLENYDKYQDWSKIKDLKLKDFLLTAQATDKYGIEGKKFAESLREFYQKALEASNNDEDFANFVRNNPNLNIEEATNLYKDVAKEGDFTDTLKEKYNFYEWKDSLIEKISFSKKQVAEIKSLRKIIQDDDKMEDTLKSKYGKDFFKDKNFDKFSTSPEIRSIYSQYEKNIAILSKNNESEWLRIKDQSAKEYMEELKGGDYLSEYLEKLQSVTKLTPGSGWLGFGKEEIDEYIMRATMKAKLDGRLNEIIINSPKTQLNTNLDNDNLDEYRPSKKIGDLKKEVLDEYKPYPNSNQEEVKTKDDLDEYKPSKKTQLNDDLNRNN